MTSRLFTAAVVVFWGVMMSWLLLTKVVPSVAVGDPPDYGSILLDREHVEQAVGWVIRLNDREIGWSIGRLRMLPDGVHELRTRVRLARLPLFSLAPSWLSALMGAEQQAEAEGAIDGGAEMRLTVDAEGTLNIDPLGRPSDLISHATIGHVLGAGESRPLMSISINGTVEGNQLNLVVRSGEFSYPTRVYLPVRGLLGDAMAPQGYLPNLRVGQVWTIPVYSTFRPPTNPVEVLQASVELKEPIVWNGRVVDTHVVVLRSDPGAGLSTERAPRGRIWVRGDGMVLKQEAQLLSSRITFVRVPPLDRTVTLDPEVMTPWWSTAPPPARAAH